MLLVLNEYSTVQVVSLEDGANIAWDTWIVATWSSDWVLQYEINENWNQWLWVKMEARTAGDVTIKVDLFDNQ